MGCTYSNQKIATDIEELFKLSIPRFPRLPSPIVAFGAQFRPGLSSKRITSDIISQFSKVGIENGNNVWEKYTALVVDTLVNAIVYDAKVTVGAKPGEITGITGAGVNAGGPVVITMATNVIPCGFNGVIS
jgi:hypothetical protein